MATASIGAESAPTNNLSFDPAAWVRDFAGASGILMFHRDRVEVATKFDRYAELACDLLRELDAADNRARVRAYVADFVAGRLS